MKPVTTATIGPSTTSRGRMSAPPCSIRKVSIVTRGSQSLVMHGGAIGRGQGQAGPGGGVVVPKVDAEGSAEIVMIGRDRRAGRERDLLGRMQFHFWTQQYAVLAADHRSFQQMLVPITGAADPLGCDVALGLAAGDREALAVAACVDPFVIAVFGRLAGQADQRVSAPEFGDAMLVAD